MVLRGGAEKVRENGSDVYIYIYITHTHTHIYIYMTWYEFEVVGVRARFRVGRICAVCLVAQ